MPRRIIADVMSWIIEALCMYVYGCFPVTSVEMPWATTLISFVCLCVACAHCGAYQCVRKSKHTAPYSVFLSQLADSHSIAGGREEPQLLSDVNAAQTLCLCGHSPSDSSNQLMGYLTLPSSPLKHTSAELLWLVMGVTDKPKCLLRTH